MSAVRSVPWHSGRRCDLRSWAAGVLLSPAVAMGAAGDVRNVDGYAVYLGVVPAAIVLGHAPAHAERQMHGGVPAGHHQHHLVVAVFDAATGVRVDDAVVSARVGEPGLAVVDKRLQPMPIAGAISYGNYFVLSPPGPYRIEVHIMRPASARPIVTTFTYSPAR